MNLSYQNTLIILLRELINAQDNVTHTNERGTEFEDNVRIFIQQREKIYQKILDIVEKIADSRKIFKDEGKYCECGSLRINPTKICETCGREIKY